MIDAVCKMTELDIRAPEVLCGNKDWTAGAVDDRMVTCMDCLFILMQEKGDEDPWMLIEP